MRFELQLVNGEWNPITNKELNVYDNNVLVATGTTGSSDGKFVFNDIQSSDYNLVITYEDEGYTYVSNNIKLKASDVATKTRISLIIVGNYRGDYEVDDIRGLTNALNGKANSTHSHIIANVTQLQNELDNKAPYTHTHSNYVISVEKQATAESGYVATYVVKQNGSQVGQKINIPKDFLVKSGSVKTCTTANVPVSGLNVGDKYIDLVLNVKEGTATDEHIYINVADLITDVEADETTITKNGKIFSIKDGGVGLNQIDTTVQSLWVAKSRVEQLETKVSNLEKALPSLSLKTPFVQSGDTSIIVNLGDIRGGISAQTLSYILKRGTSVLSEGTLSTSATGDISIPYSASGSGELSLDVSYGSLLQETYSVLDCIYYNPNDISSETQINKHIGTGDFCVEWDLKATSRTASFSYVRLGTDYNNCMQIGHLYSDGGTYIRVIQNGNQVARSQNYAVPLDTDIHCKYTRNGNTHTLEIGDAPLTLTDSTYTDLTLLQAVVTDETEDMRNLKVYLI